MKKISLISILSAMLLLMVGCTKEYITHEHYYQTIVDGSTLLNYEYIVNPNDWVTEDGVGYYYASFNNQDITQAVEDNGAVVAYVWSDGRWNLLPYVFPYYSAAEDATWGENIRFDWKKGEVTFIIQDLDGGLPEGMENIGQMIFKVCILK